MVISSIIVNCKFKNVNAIEDVDNATDVTSSSNNVNFHELPSNFKPKSSDTNSGINSDEVKEMEILGKLPYIKDLEIHHEYFLEHVKEFGLTPNICTCCGSMSKFFCMPENYIYNLYNVNSTAHSSHSQDLLIQQIFCHTTCYPSQYLYRKKDLSHAIMLTTSAGNLKHELVKHPSTRPNSVVHLIHETKLIK